MSEIILQQTRVAQGLPYYHRFVQRFPSLSHLAEASEEEVLRLWQGLGYYSRARHMLVCAKTIMEHHQGSFPTTYTSLLSLKGIGKYTAAAIASIAFKEPVAVVDGNVQRVLARVFGVEDDLATTKGMNRIAALATSLLANEQPDIYNQALMEFGALQCTPATPRCDTCCFQKHCAAFQTGRQPVLPIKNKKKYIRNRFFCYFIILYKRHIYLKQRLENDIWRGLYDFHMAETPRSVSQLHTVNTSILQLARLHGIIIMPFPSTYKHVLTHQRLHVTFFTINASEEFIKESEPLLRQEGLGAFTLSEVEQLPKPILIHNFIKSHRPIFG